MHRRDVLKALAALPLAASLSACEKKTGEKAHPSTVEDIWTAHLHW